MLQVISPSEEAKPTAINKGVCHTVTFLPLALKKYLKAKEELWKLKYFTDAKI
jgi:hypothetical protein